MSRITQGTYLDVEGTCLKGYINAKYSDIVAAFGPPLPGDMYKTDVEWIVKMGPLVATIYNWKNGYAYCKEDGTPTEDITEWNIGGLNDRAVALVLSLVKGASRC